MGNLNRTNPSEETTRADQNISVQELPIIKEDDTKSETLLADMSCVPNDIGTQGEAKIVYTRFPSGPGAKAPVSSTPLKQSPLTKSHHSASISIGNPMAKDPEATEGYLGSHLANLSGDFLLQKLTPTYMESLEI